MVRIETIAILILGTLLLGSGVSAVQAAYSGTPPVQWQELLGGSGTDQWHAIAETPDGGWICAGSSTSSVSGDVTGAGHGGTDAWVARFDGSGALQWQRLYGGAGDEYGDCIAPTADGGFVLAGSSTSNANGDVAGTAHGQSDIWLVKLDGGGAIQWQRLLGGSTVDLPRSFEQTADGGYLLLGYTLSSMSGDVTETNHGIYDAWVVKLDSAGTIQWQHLYGGAGSDIAQDIVQTSDGRYILAGYSSSPRLGDPTTLINNGGTDGWVVELDGTGMIRLHRLYGGNGDDLFRSIAYEAGSTSCTLVGSSNSSASGDLTGMGHGGTDAWYADISIGTVEYPSDGRILHQALLGGSGNDDANSVRLDPTGGCIVTGTSSSGAVDGAPTSGHGGTDVWIARVHVLGDVWWQALLGGSGQEFGAGVVCTVDGGYLVAGSSASSRSGNVAGTNHGGFDAWLAKLRLPGVPETPVCLDPASQTNPDIDGRYVVWEDARGADTDIRLLDTTTGTERVISGTGDDRCPAIDGGYVVWVRQTLDDYSLQLYEIGGGGTRTVATSTEPIYRPDISVTRGLRGSTFRVVWQQASGAESHIYLSAWTEGLIVTIRPTIGPTLPPAPPAPVRISTNPTSYNPRTSADHVVWDSCVDPNNTNNHGIYLYTIANASERLLTNGEWNDIAPAISGERVVWEHRYDVESPVSPSIMGYTISTGVLTEIATDTDGLPYRRSGPAIDGTDVVWTDIYWPESEEHQQLYAYNWSLNATQAVTAPPAHLPLYSSPAVSNGRAVWADDRHDMNIYLAAIDWTGVTPTVFALPGGAGLPTDTDADGRYDDVNGNGRRDFADVVLYFNQLSWIAANEPISAFDYNGNGRIDFADVVWLFNHL